MIDIRDFDATEIGEINSYVITQIPQSVLPQMFILTEEPMKKMKIFNIIYRILGAARDFAETGETKGKLTKMLDQYKDINEQLYPLYVNCEKASYNKHKYENKIFSFFSDQEINTKINRLINSFLVFAEKQELLETEKVTGIDMGSEEGKDLHKKLIASL